MILFWIFVEYKKIFPSLLAILLGWVHLQGFVNFTSKDNTTKQSMHVMSYNIGYLYNIPSKKRADKKKKVAEFKTFISDQDEVDVFCFQEVNKYSKEKISDVLNEYHVHEMKARGTCIYSKYPIKAKGEIDFGTNTNSCLWADLEHPKGTIRVYSVHLQSNRVSKQADEIIDNANLQEKETWDGIRGILSKYSQTTRKRAKQAALVADHAAKSPYPVLISGDLNDPPTSFTYSRLCSDYQDSFVEAGSGIGTTYAGKIPMLRIDYILADDNFSVHSFNVKKKNFSDHYPIVGSYDLK